MADKTAENASIFSKISRKGQIALICAGLFLIIGCCAAAVGLYAHFTKTEGVYEPETELDLSLDASLSGKSGIEDYINKLISDASDSNKTNTKKEVELRAENIQVENGSEDERKTLEYVLEAMLGGIKELYSTHEGSFGDGYADSSLVQLSLSEADISEVFARVGKSDNNGEVTDADKLYFGIKTTGGNYPDFISDGIGKTFSSGEAAEITEKIKSEFAQTAEIKELKIESDGFELNGCETRESGRLDNISFGRSYKISVTLEFIGKYIAFGTKTIDFDYTVSQKYSFIWAGIGIKEDSVSVAPGQQIMLTVNAIVDTTATEADFEVSFSSSDESKATVDGDGIVKGIALSTEPVEVTVRFVYLGNTYTDTCKVYVVKEVEKIEVQPESVSLEKGCTASLAYILKPSDATVTTVSWHTENADIATVDENGVVTATGIGVTKVFAVSDDGHYRASCTVTVAQGGASNG